jgi:hypothetical protein
MAMAPEYRSQNILSANGNMPNATSRNENEPKAMGRFELIKPVVKVFPGGVTGVPLGPLCSMIPFITSKTNVWQLAVST